MSCICRTLGKTEKWPTQTGHLAEVFRVAQHCVGSRGIELASPLLPLCSLAREAQYYVRWEPCRGWAFWLGHFCHQLIDLSAEAIFLPLSSRCRRLCSEWRQFSSRPLCPSWTTEEALFKWKGEVGLCTSLWSRWGAVWQRRCLCRPWWQPWLPGIGEKAVTGSNIISFYLLKLFVSVHISEEGHSDNVNMQNT